MGPMTTYKRTCHGTKYNNYRCGEPAKTDYCPVCAMEMVIQESTHDANGIFRWKSNNAVVPTSILEDAEAAPEVIKANKAARDKELDAFVAELRSRPPRQPSDEEMFEMRAAFGRGATVVNVLTGQTIKL